MMKWSQRILAFEFGGTPSQIEASRQIFLIRFFAIVGSFFLIPLGLHSILEDRYPLAAVLLLSAFVFLGLLYFSKKSQYLVQLRCIYTALIGVLTLYLILSGGAMGTGIYYTFALCMLIIAYSGHKHGLWIAGVILAIMSLVLYVDNDWFYSYESHHKLRMVLGVSLIFMMMLLFEWMRMRSYDALSVQSEDHRHSAITDALTGIYNRAGLEKNFNEWGENEFPAVAAVIDIDHFKVINDTHGHSAGDLALIAITQIFRQHIKGKDLLGRWGGEEFVLVFANSNKDNMAKVINDIRDALKLHLIEYGQSRFSLNISAGISCVQDSKSLGRALVVADERLYMAKKTGRDRVVMV